MVGHSWNGAVAQYLAERHPKRVSKLVLLDAPGLDVPSRWDFRPLEYPVVGEAIGKMMSKSMFAKTLSKAFTRTELSQAAVDEYWRPLSRRENHRAMWLLQRNLDYAKTESGLGDVRAPTLILWGGTDTFDEPSQAAELGSRIPGADCRSIARLRSERPRRLPGRVRSAIGELLRRLIGGGSFPLWIRETSGRGFGAPS